MKKLAILLGSLGFLITVGAAGGADGTPLLQSALCMAGGIALLVASERLYGCQSRFRASQAYAKKAIRPAVKSRKKPMPVSPKNGTPLQPVCGELARIKPVYHHHGGCFS